MTGNVCDDLATRLAAVSKDLGLDDADEDLLWRYLMDLPEGGQLSVEVARALTEQSELNPAAVLSYTWTATYPKRFYKPSRRRLAKLGFDLKASGRVKLREPLYVQSLEAHEQRLRSEIGRSCFYGWKDQITACIREDGRNWEPPTDLDVEVSLKLVTLNLTEKLTRMS